MKTMHAIHRARPRHRGQFVLLTAVGCVMFSLAAQARAEDIAAKTLALKNHYAADLVELAAWCEQEGLAAEAKKTRDALGPHDPYKLYLPVLPREVGPAKLPADAQPKAAQWQEKFVKLRHDQAAALYELARTAIRRHQGALAYGLVLDVIRADPDHEEVRRLLGYVKFRDGWYTPYEVRKLSAGQVWRDKFGWVPEAQLEHYERGERPAGSRWITAEEDARLHRDIRSGWEIETEHYAIRTNHSVEAGVALGVKLENLYRLWQQLFIGFYATDAYVAGLFNGHTQKQLPGPESHRFNVTCFRNREEYNRTLRTSMPNIGISFGFYFPKKRVAYFFAGRDSDDRTIYHEATHQLFGQSRRVSPTAGDKANFWIIEGIAMCMESLHQEDGYFVLGGLEDARMNAARYHLLNGDFYVPFAELIGYGKDDSRPSPRSPSFTASRRPWPTSCSTTTAAVIATPWWLTLTPSTAPRRHRHAGQADRRQPGRARAAVPGVYEGRSGPPGGSFRRLTARRCTDIVGCS